MGSIKNPFPLKTLLFIMALIFLMGLIGILVLKFMFSGNVKLRLNPVGRIQRTYTQKAVNIDSTLKHAAYMSETAENKEIIEPENTSETQFPKSQIKIEKKKGFVKVLPKPKSMKEMLDDMTEKKNQPPRVFLTKEEFKKKVYPPSGNEPINAKTVKSNSSIDFKEHHISPVDIPVKYRVFSEQYDYDAFKKTRYGIYPKANFDKEMVIILVSDSRYPNRVFEIIEAVNDKKQITVKYRVNVFKLAEEKKDYYSAVKVKKTSLPIKLKQVI